MSEKEWEAGRSVGAAWSPSLRSQLLCAAQTCLSRWEPVETLVLSACGGNVISVVLSALSA